MKKKKRAKNSCYCLVTWPSLMGDFIVRFIAMRDKNKIASFPDFLDWSVLYKRGVDTTSENGEMGRRSNFFTLQLLRGRFSP